MKIKSLWAVWPSDKKANTFASLCCRWAVTWPSPTPTHGLTRAAWRRRGTRAALHVSPPGAQTSDAWKTFFSAELSHRRRAPDLKERAEVVSQQRRSHRAQILWKTRRGTLVSSSCAGPQRASRGGRTAEAVAESADLVAVANQRITESGGEISEERDPRASLNSSHSRAPE